MCILGETPPKVGSGSHPRDVVRVPVLGRVEGPGWVRGWRVLLRVGVEVARPVAEFGAVGQGGAVRIRGACALALCHADSGCFAVGVEGRLFAMRVAAGPAGACTGYCVKASR